MSLHCTVSISKPLVRKALTTSPKTQSRWHGGLSTVGKTFEADRGLTVVLIIEHSRAPQPATLRGLVSMSETLMLVCSSRTAHHQRLSHSPHHCTQKWCNVTSRGHFSGRHIDRCRLHFRFGDNLAWSSSCHSWCAQQKSTIAEGTIT